MKEVKFLALEGGGGKGAAYITVVKVLEEKKLIDNIVAFAGASAGAITAFALSIGATSKDLEQITFDLKQFEYFLPKNGINSTIPPRPSYRCIVKNEGVVKAGKMFLPAALEQEYKRFFNKILPENLDNFFADSLFLPAPLSLGFLTLKPISKLIYFAKDLLLKERSDLVTPLTMTNLIKTGGLFNGDSIEGVFKAMMANLKTGFTFIFYPTNTYRYSLINSKLSIGEEIYKFTPPSQSDYNGGEQKLIYGNDFPNNNPYLNAVKDASNLAPPVVINPEFSWNGDLELTIDYLTFEEHYNITGKDLIVTGSNLVDGNTYYFSRYSTPDFPVISAVQISMNLPLWSPIYVSYISPSNVDYSGWYFDGGLYNNFPIRIFSDLSRNKGNLGLVRLALHEKAVGFYLDEKPTNYIPDFPGITDVGNALKDSLLDLSTFDKYFSFEKAQVLGLRTTGLDTYNFTPIKDDFLKLEEINRPLIEAMFE